MNLEKTKMIPRRNSALLNDSKPKFQFKKLQTTQFEYSNIDTNQIRRILESKKKIDDNQREKWESFQEETRKQKYTTHKQCNEIDKLAAFFVIVILFFLAILIAPNQFYKTTDTQIV